MQLRPLRRPPAALAGDQLIAVVDRPDEDRLEHAALGDRGGQLGQRLLVEICRGCAGLGRIRAISIVADPAGWRRPRAWRRAAPRRSAR